MVVTILLTGVPRHITLEDLARKLDLYITSNDVGCFFARECTHPIKPGRRLVALDFQSGFDAMMAQRQLDGFKYRLSDEGREYVLSAKVTRDKAMMPHPSCVAQLEAPPPPVYSDALVSYDGRYRYTSENDRLDVEISTLEKKMKIAKLKQAISVIEDLAKARKRERKRRRNSSSSAASSQERERRRSSAKRRRRRRSSSSSSCDKRRRDKSRGRQRRHYRRGSKRRRPSSSSSDRDNSSLRESPRSNRPKRRVRRSSTKSKSSLNLTPPIHDLPGPSTSKTPPTLKIEETATSSKKERETSSKEERDREKSPQRESREVSIERDIAGYYRRKIRKSTEKSTLQSSHSSIGSETEFKYEPLESYRRKLRKSKDSRDSICSSESQKEFEDESFLLEEFNLFGKDENRKTPRLDPGSSNTVYVDRRNRPDMLTASKYYDDNKATVQELPDDDSNEWDAVDEALEELDELTEEREPPKINLTINVVKKRKLVTDLPKEENKKKCDIIPINMPIPQKTICENPRFVLPVRQLLRKMKRYTSHIEPSTKDFFFGVMRRILRDRLKTILIGQEYMKSTEIVTFYRKQFSEDEDERLVATVLQDIEEGKFDGYIPSDEEEGPNLDTSREDQQDYFVTYSSCEQVVKDEKKERKEDGDSGVDDDIAIVEKNIELIDLIESEDLPEKDKVRDKTPARVVNNTDVICISDSEDIIEIKTIVKTEDVSVKIKTEKSHVIDIKKYIRKEDDMEIKMPETKNTGKESSIKIEETKKEGTEIKTSVKKGKEHKIKNENYEIEEGEIIESDSNCDEDETNICEIVKCETVDNNVPSIDQDDDTLDLMEQVAAMASNVMPELAVLNNAEVKAEKVEDKSELDKIDVPITANSAKDKETQKEIIRESHCIVAANETTNISLETVTTEMVDPAESVGKENTDEMVVVKEEIKQPEESIELIGNFVDLVTNVIEIKEVNETSQIEMSAKLPIEDLVKKELNDPEESVEQIEKFVDLVTNVIDIDE